MSTPSAQPEHLVFFVVLGACVCGALIAVGVVGYVLWLANQLTAQPDGEQQERRWR